MPQKVCFASVDVEADFGQGVNFLGVQNLRKLLCIFKKHDIPTTLFVTGEILEKHKEDVKEWSENCEIASHGFSHTFWNNLKTQERKEELERFNILYEECFGLKSKGFRAPSHLVDEEALSLLEEKGFLYDSSVVPRYPFFKSYRGFQGKAPLSPYHPDSQNCRSVGKMDILEIPVAGHVLGIPLAGKWISKLPFWFYSLLLRISNPVFLTLNLHSWDSLDEALLEKIDRLIALLKEKGYYFFSGSQIYEQFSKSQQ